MYFSQCRKATSTFRFSLRIVTFTKTKIAKIYYFFISLWKMRTIFSLCVEILARWEGKVEEGNDGGSSLGINGLRSGVHWPWLNYVCIRSSGGISVERFGPQFTVHASRTDPSSFRLQSRVKTPNFNARSYSRYRYRSLNSNTSGIKYIYMYMYITVDAWLLQLWFIVDRKWEKGRLEWKEGDRRVTSGNVRVNLIRIGPRNGILIESENSPPLSRRNIDVATG